MSEDARNSLTAWITVSLFCGIFYAAVVLLKRVDIPRWLPDTLFALNALGLVVAWIRWRRRQAGLQKDR